MKADDITKLTAKLIATMYRLVQYIKICYFIACFGQLT